ncbi:MAG: hypothetical protein EHM49_01190 [Deltaproteobacteria bacterium]|nr:MAG: hypothetical protein EHM49_01190 [Deltaproteobacteria bacterium]
MAFNPDVHQIKLLVINCGKLLWPEERNVTTLYRKASEALGIPTIETTSASATHLPTPKESAQERPEKFASTCPKCGEKSYYIVSLCKSCKASEGGKYKVMFECYKCGYSEKSEEPMVVWLERLGIDFGTQTKKSLGIETLTDEGLK